MSSGTSLEPTTPITVKQYHALIDAGELKDDDPVELLEGVLVFQMPKKPIHWIITRRLRRILEQMSLTGHFIHSQDPITTLESEPEPDIAIIEGEEDDYLENNPPPEKVKLVVEVSDTTLEHDRGIKRRVYARAGIPIYWIVNVGKRVVEVYSQPTGTDRNPRYLKCLLVQVSDQVSVKIGRKVVGMISVSELFKSKAE